MRKARARSAAAALAVGLLSLMLVVAGPAQAGNAVAATAVETSTNYGDPAEVVLEAPRRSAGVAEEFAWKTGNWYMCRIVGWWESYGDDDHTLRWKGTCDRGAIADDEYWALKVTTSNGAISVVMMGNVDDEENFAGVLFEHSNDPGLVSELCIRREGGTFGVGPTMSATECQPWAVGAPPGSGADPWYGTGTAGCSAYVPLAPWVSNYEAVAVTGGWAWRSTLIMAVPWSRDPAYPTLEGTGLAPYATASVTTTSVTVTSPDGSTAGPSGTGPGAFINGRYYTPSGNPVAVQRTFVATGPVHATGSPGSSPLDWQWRGAGVYWSSNVSGASGSAHQAYATRPTVAQIASTPRYGGHHDPERCHFWWGSNVFPTDTSGYADPAGPLTFQTSSTPPPPAVTNPAPPIAGPDVYPDPPPDPDTLPPTDDDSCEGFSLTDPSSWAGPAMCMIVRAILALIDVVSDLLGLIGDVLAFLAGLIGALKDLLLLLFIPTGDGFGGALDSLRSSWDDGAGGAWSDALAPPGGAGEEPVAMRTFGVEAMTVTSEASGSCEGPTVDLGSLGLDGMGVTPEPLHPFAACEGTTASVAANVRLWTGVGLMVGGAFKIFEMILGAFGAIRQVRIMSDHDWSGRLK